MENSFENIIKSIKTLNTKDDLVIFYKKMQEIYEAFEERQKKINTLHAQSFCTGDRVIIFDPVKNKNVAQGEVTKVKIKNILVLTDDGITYDVPAALCTDVLKTEEYKEVA